MGAYQSCGLKSYDNVQLLKTASKVGEPLTYQINANSREALKKDHHGNIPIPLVVHGLCN